MQDLEGTAKMIDVRKSHAFDDAFDVDDLRQSKRNIKYLKINRAKIVLK